MRPEIMRQRILKVFLIPLSGLELERIAKIELDVYLSLIPGLGASWRSSLCGGRFNQPGWKHGV
jgi:hypothetical protein